VGEFTLDVTYRKVLRAKADDLLPNGVPLRRRVGAMKDIFEETGLTIRVMTELATKDAKGSRRVPETLRHLVRRLSINEICPQSLVLAMQRPFRFKEEPLFRC
jgi:hypothetical protein